MQSFDPTNLGAEGLISYEIVQTGDVPAAAPAARTVAGKHYVLPTPPAPSGEDVFPSWACLGVSPPITTPLLATGFAEPTEVQQAAVPSIQHGRDVLVAGGTGAGKTLAYVVPLMGRLAEQLEREHAACPPGLAVAPPRGPRGLILAPTRELAQQIFKVVRPFADHIGCGAALICGGLAPQKQLRVLSSHPAVIVATPGRLWELVSEGVVGLRSLGQLSFLVVDEADRLLERGRFKELSDVLERVVRDEAESGRWKLASAEETAAARAAAAHAYGAPADASPEDVEAAVQALFEGEVAKRVINGADAAAVAVPNPLGDWVQPEPEGEGEEGDDEEDEEESESVAEAEAEAEVHWPLLQPRQTVLVSATLALPDAAKQTIMRKNEKRKIASKTIAAKTKAKAKTSTDNATMEEVVLKLHLASARPPVIVDVGSGKLASNLIEVRAQCADLDDKNTTLALLLTRPVRLTGRTIDIGGVGIGDTFAGTRTVVFVNAITAARTISTMLSALGVEHVSTLHSQMGQAARLAALDRFAATEHGVLVCTDVGARGIDIPAVSTVVHYHAPMSVDAFLHRSGRAARGAAQVAGDVGIVLELVGPDEFAAYHLIWDSLRGGSQPPAATVDAGFVREMHSKVKLALKAASLEAKRGSAARDGKLERTAAEISTADIVVNQAPKIRHEDVVDARKRSNAQNLLPEGVSERFAHLNAGLRAERGLTVKTRKHRQHTMSIEEMRKLYMQ